MPEDCLFTSPLEYTNEHIPSQNLLKQADFYREGVRKQFQKEGQEWKDRQVFVYILD